MQVKTRGIVFGTTRYGESSMIARIYTEELGLRSFMVRGVRKKRSTRPASLLQHLSLVELQARIKERSDIQNLGELRLEYPFASIPFDIIKSTQVLFINELLSKSIREQEKNPDLFNFLHHAIRLLDMHEGNMPDFHLVFAIRLTRFLGFFPTGSPDSTHTLFDLRAGLFCSSRPLHGQYIEAEEAIAFTHLLGTSFETIGDFNVGAVMRRRLIHTIIDYYRLHIDSFGTFRSAEILETVFS